jgi:O-antigen/teichoic acid export membrane protein
VKKNTGLVFQHVIWRGLYFFSVLLLNIGIARFFAAEKSGQIFFIVNNLALILLLVSISLESGSAYYIASENLESSQLARFCLIWAIVASLIAIAIWWPVVYFTHPSFLTDYGFLLASFLFILGVLFTTYYTALFYSKKKFGLPNKILFFVNILLIAILCAGKNNLGIRGHFIQVYFFSFFLQGLLMMCFFFGKETSPGKFIFPTRSLLKKVIQYSMTALIANLIYFLVNRIDYWFVQYFCTAKDLGNYIQASKLEQMLFILPAILGATLFPIFSSQKESRNTAELTTAIRVLFFINGVICLLIVCFGWYIFPLFFGPTFSQMYLLFVLLIPGILCVTMNYPMASWFAASKRIGINIRGSLIALIVISIGDIVALPRYGVRAASVISSVGYFSYFYFAIYIYRKEVSIPWGNFLLIRKSDLIKIWQSLGTKLQEPSPKNYIV